MRIAICNESDSYNNCLKKMIKGFSLQTSVAFFCRPEALFFALEEGQQYDVILMDIVFTNSKISGMIAAERIYELQPIAKIVFMTDYSVRFCQEIFLHKTNLGGYLVKPVDQKLLFVYLEKLESEREQVDQSSCLHLHINTRPLTLPYRDIIYVESSGHNIYLHTCKEQLSVYMTLAEVKTRLPESFYQVHRSYIVNMCQIHHFQGNGIIMKNGDFIPVSRARYKEIKNRYIGYMGDR